MNYNSLTSSHIVGYGKLIKWTQLITAASDALYADIRAYCRGENRLQYVY